MDNVIHLLGAWPVFHSLASLLSASCAAFIERPLDQVFYVVSKDITFLNKRSMVGQHAHFTPDRLFARKVYMIYPGLSSATLLGVGWQGGSPSIFLY